MADLQDQCVFIKFCFKLGLNAMETSEMMKVASGEQTVGRT
jgi:hypothetical protein